ncbi:hypothetical protein [Streptomyces chryseus]
MASWGGAMCDAVDGELLARMAGASSTDETSQRPARDLRVSA